MVTYKKLPVTYTFKHDDDKFKYNHVAQYDDNGRIHGWAITLFQNSINTYYTAHHGQTEGVKCRYYLDGSLAEVAEYKDGKRCGLSIEFNVEGTLVCFKNCYRGNLHGVNVNFQLNGEIFNACEYVDGDMMGRMYRSSVIDNIKTYRYNIIKNDRFHGESITRTIENGQDKAVSEFYIIDHHNNTSFCISNKVEVFLKKPLINLSHDDRVLISSQFGIPVIDWMVDDIRTIFFTDKDLEDCMRLRDDYAVIPEHITKQVYV